MDRISIIKTSQIPGPDSGELIPASNVALNATQIIIIVGVVFLVTIGFLIGAYFYTKNKKVK